MSFARQVVGADASPFYINCSPLQDALENDCFPLIENYVARHGGTSVFGWAIWERPKVFIEAEFHAVWCAPDGSYLDLSPRPLPIPRILFLPNHNRKYNGAQVNNIRKALTKDKDVQRFLSLSDHWFRLINKGELKYKREVKKTPEMFAVERERTALNLKLLYRYGPWLPES